MKNIFLSFLFAIFSYTSSLAQYTKLLDFANDTVHGFYPTGSLISDGTFLYGSTNLGGLNDSGTVFKIKPDGTGYVKLMDCDGAANGSYPGDLFYDGTSLYGVTSEGGVNNLGTIFKIMPDGSGYVKLLDFDGAMNGSYPSGALISDGAFLYGVTYRGGTNNMGTIFKILPNGSGYIKLLDFAGSTNGNFPIGALYYDGTFLYGTTQSGGANGAGTIYKIMPDGTGYVKLKDFSSITSGWYIEGSLISDGTFLYGTAHNGGLHGYGTLYKIMPNGTGFVKMLDFQGGVNGQGPVGRLCLDGNLLFGMTSYGGLDSAGTVFKIKTDGSNYTVMMNFHDTLGCNAFGSVISDGAFLYGMTPYCGDYGGGTLFELGLTTGISETNIYSQISIFPNPFSAQTTLQSELPLNNATLTVLNCFGQTVSQIKNINGETITFSRGNLASGIYFVSLTEGNRNISIGKLIISD